jgi:hypothetical protein
MIFIIVPSELAREIIFQVKILANVSTNIRTIKAKINNAPMPLKIMPKGNSIMNTLSSSKKS